VNLEKEWTTEVKLRARAEIADWLLGWRGKKEEKETFGETASGINRFSGQRIGGTILTLPPQQNYLRYWEIRQNRKIQETVPC
jgi:hypothetical protein